MPERSSRESPARRALPPVVVAPGRRARLRGRVPLLTMREVSIIVGVSAPYGPARRQSRRMSAIIRNRNNFRNPLSTRSCGLEVLLP